MPNPIHIDANCSNNQVSQRRLSDQEASDYQSLQAQQGAQQQADADDWSTRRAQVRTLLLAHPELQPLIDILRIKLS